MNIKIPDQLKSDLPSTFAGKVLSATPVVLTVLATMLAGLASSEMTRAQYERSLAAQQQSKAGDQWNFFQAKRLRGSVQRGSYDLLANTTEVHPLDPDALRQAAEQVPSSEAALKSDLLALLASPAGQNALQALQKSELPTLPAAAPVDERIKAVNAAIDGLQSDETIATLLDQVDSGTLDRALLAASQRAQAFDSAMKPISDAIDRFDMLLTRLAAATPPVGAGQRSVYRDFTVLRLRFTSLRYDAEARLNQTIAGYFELQVRKSNRSAERHHTRSQRFFYGMLAAQMGVIIATFAMAARRRNLLWSLAAAAGLGAILFAAYVFLAV